MVLSFCAGMLLRQGTIPVILEKQDLYSRSISWTIENWFVEFNIERCILNYLKKCLKPYWKEAVLAPAFKMLEALFDLFVPMVIARMINVGITAGDKPYIIRCALLLAALALTGLLLSFAAQYFAAKTAVGVSARMRSDLFAHILTLSAQETDTIGTSTLITRMTSDINQVQNGLNLFLRLFLRSPFIVFGAMIMAFLIHPRIALIFAAVIPLLSIVVILVMRWTSPRYRMVQENLDRLTGLTRENLTGVRVVRAFGREENKKKKYAQENDRLMTMQNRVGLISALMNPASSMIVNLGIALLLYTGGKAVGSGVLMRGEVIALVNYMSQILVELIKLANLIVSISKAAACLKRTESVLETESSMHFPEKHSKKKDTAAHTGTIPSALETVAFEHVSFRYAGSGEESVTDLNFIAKRGQTIGVIGGTGSGKSTLVQLLARRYDATEGVIRLMGRPVQEWTKEELNHMVAAADQKVQLFSGTIRSNLCMGNPEASDEEMWNALRIAQAEEFVRSRPGGLDDEIEQGGRNLSGGQKQRLTIARALAAKPEVLILDDSSSALDYATDAALRKALRSLPRSMTVFLVSQRTVSLKNADAILVMDDGRMVDFAPHDILLQRCEVYKEIYESQFRTENPENGTGRR